MLLFFGPLYPVGNISNWIHIRSCPLLENPLLTQILVSNMFSGPPLYQVWEINFQNWSNGSNLKLWQKSVNTQYRFQKFLRVEKMPGAKKVVTIKISFFMPVNHVKEYLISIHISVVFSHFYVGASNCSHYSNFENWCLKMKSRGLYHTYILWKSGLLLDFQQVKLY